MCFPNGVEVKTRSFHNNSLLKHYFEDWTLLRFDIPLLFLANVGRTQNNKELSKQLWTIWRRLNGSVICTTWYLLFKNLVIYFVFLKFIKSFYTLISIKIFGAIFAGKISRPLRWEMKLTVGTVGWWWLCASSYISWASVSSEYQDCFYGHNLLLQYRQRAGLHTFPNRNYCKIH